VSASARPLPRARTPEGVWADLINAIDSAAYEFAQMGESEQSRALSADADYIARRAKLHLRKAAR
jgi:hypothetical protein